MKERLVAIYARVSTEHEAQISACGAWLSSARVVRCWVKSRNERNPYPMLPARKGGDS